MPWSVLALAVALAQLVALPVPGGGTVTVDSPLAPPLVVLAELPVGQPLVAALAWGDVQVEIAVEPLERYGEYDPD